MKRSDQSGPWAIHGSESLTTMKGRLQGRSFTLGLSDVARTCPSPALA